MGRRARRRGRRSYCTSCPAAFGDTKRYENTKRNEKCNAITLLQKRPTFRLQRRDRERHGARRKREGKRTRFERKRKEDKSEEDTEQGRFLVRSTERRARDRKIDGERRINEERERERERERENVCMVREGRKLKGSKYEEHETQTSTK